MNDTVAFELSGTVVHGEKRGRALGFPTANLALVAGPDGDTADGSLPADGVYAGVACVAPVDAATACPPTCRVTAISIGTNPTFGGTARTVEAYLLDFDDDLYGRHVRLHGAGMIRPMRAFACVEDLVAQMGRDVAAVRERVELAGHAHDRVG